MIDRDLAKERTALSIARRARLAKDGQTAMEEYDAKRRAAYANAERLRALRQERDAADAEKVIAKKISRRRAVVARTRMRSPT
jgi:hypothetical protein